MLVRQVTVFLENRKGRLEEVAKVLSENHVNINSISLADTNEYGLLRLILSDPEKGKQVLHDAGFSATLTNVLAIRLANKEGKLYEAVKILSEAEINVEYMYVLDNSVERGSIIIKVPAPEKAVETLCKAGLEFYDEKSLGW